MTFWNRLMLDYPDLRGYDQQDKAVQCPSCWGYETRRKGQCMQYRTCEECWNREMPEKAS